ncbi:MAG TPA: NADPH dehydrogenase NamA [Bacteroidales bacterium]|nr:NADPH dehydrogenase NamA [Bacteroidales bacterium]
MSILFTPLQIRDITFKNRIVMSPMCQYSSKDGYANNWHLVHLASRAAGGTGLIIQEATAVSPEGRISPADLGLWSDDHITQLSAIVEQIHSNGAVAGIQLAHAGRKGSTDLPWNGGAQLDENSGGWRTIGPSAIPFMELQKAPEALSINDIERIVQCFRDAAVRALKAGYRVVEVHSAHGYLLHEFLSPLSNNRTDEYGGPFENRVRLLLRVATEVRSVWPDGYPVFVRISATDWAEGGWSLEESIKVAALLKDAGIDLIDCSSGGNIANAQIPLRPGYQVPFADAIKKTTGIMTGAVGLITSAAQAEQILYDGSSDLILLGRQLLRDPYFALNAAAETGDKAEWPKQYLRAKKI